MATATKTAHTPGPWAFEEAKRWHIPPSTDFTLRIYAEDPGPTRDFTIGTVSDVDTEQREANARLIAAAPTMLSALRCAEAVLYLLSEDADELGCRANKVLPKVMAAIQLAEGK